MKVPISWLKEYVDFEDTPAGLAERLTFSGIEVEGIETIGGMFSGIMVGAVLQVERHPNADKLTLCTVDTGAGQIVVVCGAPNVQAGGKYPFAPAGVTLPNGTKLKKARIRGVESAGMLCAKDELGLSDDHSGLLELDSKWAPGTPLAEVMGPPDTVLELEITPNRPDCLCLMGVAREVAALYGTRLKMPAAQPPESGRPVAELTRVAVEDAAGCPRYTARILNDVKIGPAPDWMRQRLEKCGIRAINNVVDITNYVMLECGQPLHAFDQSLLAEGRIVVRRARPGERMATLDNIERPLAESMLMICDAERPVAVAGIMGGAGSEIRETTRTVLLESACFQPIGIRATSRQLGLATESSYRFERGVDPELADWASRRAAQLMGELAGATCAPGVVDVYPRPPAPRRVACRFARLNEVLGLQVDGARVVQVFEALSLPVAAHSEAGCAVDVPSFRGDLEREIDLIEEFARIHGLDRIPAPAPRAAIVPGADDRAVRAAQLLRAHLVGLGLREIMNYSFMSQGLLDRFDPDDAPRRVLLPNPISADHTVLRNSLIPQLVETLGRNLARQIRAAAFFEMGRVFFRDNQGQPTEESRCAIGLMGPVGRTGLEGQAAVSEEDQFLWLKGIWERLLQAQKSGPAEFDATARPYFEPGRAVTLFIEGQQVGVMGLIRSAIRKEWRMSGPVAVLEARVEPLLARCFEIKGLAPLAAFPAVTRDAALIVDERVRHTDIEKIIQKVAPKELERVELFDIFRTEGIGVGRKSMAYSFTYRSLTRTLTDEDANQYHAAVKEALKRELSAEIRES